MDVSLLPPGVVFDCDGTLADTESISDQAWVDVLRRHGYEPAPEDFEAVLGRPWPFCWAYFRERADLDDERRFAEQMRTRFGELLDEGLELYEDALGTLRTLAGHGVAIAVASSSVHAHVVGILARGGVTEHVSAIVGQDDVSSYKPEPTPYLEAARLLGIEPDRCVAVEDTAVGVASAVAAGMYTVGVVRRATSPDALSEAHRVVDAVSVEALVPASDAMHG